MRLPLLRGRQRSGAGQQQQLPQRPCAPRPHADSPGRQSACDVPSPPSPAPPHLPSTAPQLTGLCAQHGGAETHYGWPGSTVAVGLSVHALEDTAGRAPASDGAALARTCQALCMAPPQAFGAPRWLLQR